MSTPKIIRHEGECHTELDSDCWRVVRAWQRITVDSGKPLDFINDAMPRLLPGHVRQSLSVTESLENRTLLVETIDAEVVRIAG